MEKTAFLEIESLSEKKKKQKHICFRLKRQKQDLSNPQPHTSPNTDHI